MLYVVIVTGHGMASGRRDRLPGVVLLERFEELAESLHLRARSSTEHGTDARTLLTEAISRNPDQFQLLYARSLQQLGELELAAEEFATLVQGFAGEEARVRYGLLLKQLGRANVHAVPGNHDNDLEESTRLYAEVFPGRLNYTWEHGGWQFVAIDTTDVRVARVDDEEAVHAEIDLRHLVEVRVVHQRAGLLQREQLEHLVHRTEAAGHDDEAVVDLVGVARLVLGDEQLVQLLADSGAGVLQFPTIEIAPPSVNISASYPGASARTRNVSS